MAKLSKAYTGEKMASKTNIDEWNEIHIAYPEKKIKVDQKWNNWNFENIKGQYFNIQT